MDEANGPAALLVPPDAEAASARVVFRELDRAGRAMRTYGPQNSVALRFFGLLEKALASHLESWPILGVVVERAELRLLDEVIYRSEDTVGESLAFRLYSDGVRELRFAEGVTAGDLRGLLDALWGPGDDSPDADDDVVTRLWAKDLATISFVTAEDVMRAPWDEQELEVQEHGFFAPPPPSFGPLLEREQSAAAPAGPARSGPPSPADALGPPRAAGRLGFEIGEAERRRLEEELALERAVDAPVRVLEMVSAILHSETSPVLLMRALSIAPGILDVTLQSGRWELALFALAALEQAAEKNIAFDQTHRLVTRRILDSLSLPQRLGLVEQGLAAAPGADAGKLAELLTHVTVAGVGALCSVLAAAQAAEHRAVLRAALVRLAAQHSEPVLMGFADPRPQYVHDLIAVVVAWARPQGAEELAMLANHPDAGVRRAAVSAIARLLPRGDGGPLVSFASDADPEARSEALQKLATGRYQADYERWTPHLQALRPEERERADNRLLFQALRVTAGEASAAFFGSLLEKGGWTNRQKREETALLAVKALGALHSPAARAALESGLRGGSGAVRKACEAALAAGEAEAGS